MAINRKIPASDSEFGGGPGMIDPTSRAAREVEGHQLVWEIYATNPARPNTGNGKVAAGEQQLGPENLPETAQVERP